MMNKRLRYLKRILSAYVFSAKNSNVAFWHTPLRVNALNDDDFRGMRAYPQNFEDKIDCVNTVDDCGVIMLNYKGGLGLQYNPNAIAQLALGYYDRILSGQDCAAEYFRQASYFLRHGRLIENDVLLWEYNFPFENRNYLHAPWRSALAQGQGISVCLRAHELTDDDRYLSAAKLAFNSFRHLARRHPGGVLDDDGGYTWLEEYILDPPNHVLNGFIWALWGVRDYAIYMKDSYAWDLWKECLKTLVANVERYDFGFWTSYDLVDKTKTPVMPVSLYYQNLHCVQMEAMYLLTREPIFLRFAQRWRSQHGNLFSCARSQVWKTYFKLMRF